MQVDNFYALFNYFLKRTITQYKDKNTNNSYKTYKKVPILIVSSTKTLMKNLF